MLETYRKWLISIWSAGFLIPFVLILIQYGYGKYGGKTTETLGWLTALTLPTILLMFGVMVANPTAAETKDDAEKKKTPEEIEAENRAAASKLAHEKFIFKFAVGVSIIYLLIINLSFFAEPLLSAKPQDLMRESKVYLAIFDSIISLLIGYFFGKR